MVGEMALKVFWVCGGSKDDLSLSYLKLGSIINGLAGLLVLFEYFCRCNSCAVLRSLVSTASFLIA